MGEKKDATPEPPAGRQPGSSSDVVTPPSDETRSGRSRGPETHSVAPESAAGSDSPRQPHPGLRPSFAANQILAERYRIVRFIARGGMGEVYEVDDLALKGRVALKTIRPEIAEQPRVLERFRREIHLARKVTHPNVCRIHDLGSCRMESADGVLEDLYFLTMELLSGETLSSRIARGRLSTTDALPIVAQIAAGLDAAHRAGIIHRDFKSGNVMLVPAPDASQPPRVVVTDFGLARTGEADEALASISETGAVVGTPAYMAPEQVQGRPLTPAADIYALGIVLYEMVTGVRPFDGGSAISIAVRRLTEAPRPPRDHAADLDPAWESAILRCLEKDPDARFPNAVQLLSALGGAAPSLQPGASRPTPAVTPQHSAWLRIGLPAAIVLSLAAGIASLLSRRPEPATSPTTQPAAPAAINLRRSVAVLGFKNLSGRPEAAWLSTAIAEMLTSDISAGGKIRTLSGQEMARVKRELGVVEGEDLTREQLGRLRTNLGADMVIWGSYTSLDQPGSRLLRVDVRLQDTATAQLLASGSATGTEGGLFDLVSRSGEALREKLGLGQVSPTQALQVRAALPANAEAARHYSEGLARLRVFDASGARTALETAIALEPKHPLPRAALAAAWSALGYEKNAREEAKAAADLAGALGDEDKLAIEALLHETNKQWPKAIEAYEALVKRAPDNLDWRLRLAEAQVSSGKAKEALVTIEGMRRLPAPLSQDARIDISEARAYNRLGDTKRYLASASQASAKARAQGAGLLVAQAQLLEAAALEALGQPQQALKTIDQAMTLFEGAGDRGGVGRCLERMGLALRTSGDLDGAKRIFERALQTHREIGNESSAARTLNNLATVLIAQGQLAEAKRLSEEALRAFERAGAKLEAAVALNSMGSLFHRVGDLGEAARRYEQALAGFGEMGDRRSTAVVLGNLVEVRLARGELKWAQELLEEALAIERETSRKAGIAYKLFRLGDVFRVRGDLTAAGDRYREAIEVQRQLGDKTGVAETQLGLAAVAFAQQRFDEAEKLASESEEILRTAKANDKAALAQALLAEVLLARDKTAEAQKLAARGLWPSSQDKLVRLTGAIVSARIKASDKGGTGVPAALASLKASAAECAGAGFVLCDFEARLAMGQIELASGKKPAGEARLKSVARDAEAKGLGLIVRRASQPSSAGPGVKR